MGYKDILIYNYTIPSGTQQLLVEDGISGLTGSHVLLNDALPKEVAEDIQWTTQDFTMIGDRVTSGRLTLSLANQVNFSNDLNVTLVFGIPET